MAQCKKCSKSASCSCSLIDGYCMSCYSESFGQQVPPEKKSTARKIFKQLPDAPPNTEFDNILSSTTMTRDEKLKKINDILDKATQ